MAKLTLSGTCTLIFIRLCFALRRVRKFMVGYEMLATPQRGRNPESAAECLRCKFVAGRMIMEKSETGNTIMHNFVTQRGEA